jgi:hypothetical protein
MPRITIIGDRDSGKTTFLVLLYATQVRSGSDLSDEFRFHVAMDSIEEISGAFQQLMSGAFPDSATKEGIRELTVDVSYRRSRRGMMSRFRSRNRTEETPAKFKFILMRNLEEEVARFRSGRSFTSGPLRDFLESEAIVVLVDAGKLVVSEETRDRSPMAKYDVAVEALLSAVPRRPGSDPGRRRRPVFVFSKFETVDQAALAAAEVETTPPELRHTAARKAYGEALLKYNLPRTTSILRSASRSGPSFASPTFVFSWVRTEPPQSNRAGRIRLTRTGAAGWEPDYSRDEYRALLDSLRDLV